MIEALTEDLERALDAGSFERVLGDRLKEEGFDRFAYLALRLPESGRAPFVVTTYPQDWAVHYTDQDYVNFDPVLLQATGTMRPFNWHTLAADPKLSTNQHRVLDEARDFGITNGGTVPIHAPGGGFSTLSVASSVMSDREFAREWRRLSPYLHMAALYSHSAVEARLLNSSRAEPIALTDRERECLLWTARGKTSAEIGTILAISSETVVFHLKNAMRKLSVYSKHHAVVKAIMMGVIHP